MATRFNRGDTAVVRTSGEVVFILEIRPAKETVGDGISDDYGFEDVALVKRPIASRNGIEHVTDYMFLEELESPDEKLRKDYESFKDLYASGQTNVTMPVSGASN